MEYSLDGEYLASGSEDGSIRIWHRESFHTTTSTPHMERPIQTPKQADKIMSGSRVSNVMAALSFSRTDSNLLASGGSNGEINVWNVENQACVHTFNPGRGRITSLFFAGGAGGADIACIAVANTGSIIRLWRAEGSSEFASETMGEGDLRGGTVAHRCVVFFPCGSFVATGVTSRTGNENKSALALYELETMSKTKSVVMPDLFATCLAVSSDSKLLVCGGVLGRIRLVQTDDFSIQRDLDIRGEGSNMPVYSVAFDPTCRVLAFGHQNGRLELRAL
jgi:WD40 repeat protein